MLIMKTVRQKEKTAFRRGGIALTILAILPTKVRSILSSLVEKRENRRNDEEDSEHDGGDEEATFETALGVGDILTAAEDTAQSGVIALKQNRDGDADSQNHLNPRQNNFNNLHHGILAQLLIFGEWL